MLSKKALSMFVAAGCIMSVNFSMPVYCAPQTTAVVTETQQKGTASLQTMSLLWMRSAAEYRALCYQGYNVAMEKVQNALEQKKIKKSTRPLAIVVDCDETVVDNTKAMALAAVAGNTNYSGLWWRKTVQEGKATALPGATEFLQQVSKKGVEIFYVSNRYEKVNYVPTLKSLQALKFPNVDRKHVKLMVDTANSNKQGRFDAIAKDYDVVVYLGDNAGDLPLGTYGKKMQARNAIIDNNKNAFGTKFIMFPNPAYGSWVSSLADKYSKLSAAEKDNVNREVLVKN